MNRRRIFSLVLFFLILGIISSAIGFFHETEDGKNISDFEDKNVIIISVDPMRADRLPCYGHYRNTAPNICKMAKEGFKFDQAYATSIWTLPSTSSLFSSNYPSVHEAYNKNQDNFNPVGPTVAEVFRRNGYRTAGFVGSGYIGPRFGVDEGFNIYKESARSVDSKPKSLQFNKTIPMASNWIKNNTDDPYFLYLQSFDPHAPFHNPEPFSGNYSDGYDGILKNLTLDYGNAPGEVLDKIRYTEEGPVLYLNNSQINLSSEDIQYIKNKYDEGILYSDYKVGEFLKNLRRNNEYNDSIIIITSAHGESIADRNIEGRKLVGRYAPYQEIIRVPLIINYPGLDGKSNARVSLLDIMPTLVELMGFPNDSFEDTMQGMSFVNIIQGEGSHRQKIYFEHNLNSVRGVLKGDLKYWEGRNQARLFNISNDVNEKRDISDKHPKKVKELRTDLEEFRLMNSRLRGGRNQ